MKRETKAGIYITVSIHLAVIIVLLLTVVTPSLKRGESFELDFSKQDELERLEEELAKKMELNRRLNRMLAEAGLPQEAIRNVAVDKGALKDDRGTDAEQLYKDAARIAKDFENGYEYDVIRPEKPEHGESGESVDSHEEQDYHGPAVVSYTLEGRKASHLSVPAYKCFLGGEVTVYITVEPSGKVLNAVVLDAVSSDDQCLRDYAVKASMASRFSRNSTAPAKQIGNIVYKFIAQ